MKSGSTGRCPFCPYSSVERNTLPPSPPHQIFCGDRLFLGQEVLFSFSSELLDVAVSRSPFFYLGKSSRFRRFLPCFSLLSIPGLLLSIFSPYFVLPEESVEFSVRPRLCSRFRALPEIRSSDRMFEDRPPPFCCGLPFSTNGCSFYSLCLRALRYRVQVFVNPSLLTKRLREPFRPVFPFPN